MDAAPRNAEAAKSTTTGGSFFQPFLGAMSSVLSFLALAFFFGPESPESDFESDSESLLAVLLFLRLLPYAVSPRFAGDPASEAESDDPRLSASSSSFTKTSTCCCCPLSLECSRRGAAPL